MFFFSVIRFLVPHHAAHLCKRLFCYRSFRIVLSRQGAVSGIALQNRFAAYYARRDAALMAAMRGTPPALGALKKVIQQELPMPALAQGLRNGRQSVVPLFCGIKYLAWWKNSYVLE